MQPKFLLDAHISPLVAEMLAQQGIEARAGAGSDLADAPDEELLRIATEEGLIVITYDTDTMPALLLAAVLRTFQDSWHC